MEDQLLTTNDAAAFLGIKPATLNQWRSYGRGPTYVKIGTCVRYRMSALSRFLEQNSVVTN